VEITVVEPKRTIALEQFLWLCEALSRVEARGTSALDHDVTPQPNPNSARRRAALAIVKRLSLDIVITPETIDGWLVALGSEPLQSR